MLAGSHATDDDGEDPIYRALCVRAVGTNLSERTLLATDYLNHFNEIVMLLEMIPDMPEIIEDAKAWEPLGYQDHFRRSGFADRDLAIEAYDHVPPRFREPFETTIAQLNELIASTIAQIDGQTEGVPSEQLRSRMDPVMTSLRRLIDAASGIIHGSDRALSQDEIDRLI